MKVLFFLLSLITTQVLAQEFYVYHCGFKMDKSGEYANIWSTSLLGPFEAPELGESYDWGSLIFDNKLAICMMASGSQKENTFEAYINFYEGDSINYAPGQCSFLGVDTYRPFGILSSIDNEQITAEYRSITTNDNYLVFLRILSNQSEFLDDKCNSDLFDYQNLYTEKGSIYDVKVSLFDSFN